MSNFLFLSVFFCILTSLIQPSLAFIWPIHEITSIESKFIFTELFMYGTSDPPLSLLDGDTAKIHVELLIGITTNKTENPIVKLAMFKVPNRVKTEWFVISNSICMLLTYFPTGYRICSRHRSNKWNAPRHARRKWHVFWKDATAHGRRKTWFFFNLSWSGRGEANLLFIRKLNYFLFT